MTEHKDITMIVSQSQTFKDRVKEFKLVEDIENPDYRALLVTQAMVIKDAILARDGYEVGVQPAARQLALLYKRLAPNSTGLMQDVDELERMSTRIFPALQQGGGFSLS